MKKVLWVLDEPNWAYDVNVKALAKNMPQYKHSFLYMNYESVVDNTEFDITVVMMASYFNKCLRLNNVISVLDSVRATIDPNINTNYFKQVVGIISTNKVLDTFAKTLNNKSVLIPNGVDLNYYKPVEKKNDIFTIGFAGNSKGAGGIYKGFNIYQDAMEVLSRTKCNIKQLTASYGKNQIPADRMVEEFYHKINCFILLSINEGCSNVITEALACGVPVICTKVGYHGEFLTDNQNVIFSDRNISAVGQNILRLYQSEESQNIIGRASRLFAEQHHNIKDIARRYSELFENWIVK